MLLLFLESSFDVILLKLKISHSVWYLNIKWSKIQWVLSVSSSNVNSVLFNEHWNRKLEKRIENIQMTVLQKLARILQLYPTNRTTLKYAGIDISVKLVTSFEGDPKISFSIATAPKCRGERYSFPWIAPLYSWSLPCSAEC